MTAYDYEAVRQDIAAQLKKPGYDDGSAGPVFVRLAWSVNLPSSGRGHGLALPRHH